MLGLTASKGANLLAASNAINAVARILTGFAGDRLGRQNTLVLTLLLAASSVFTFWLSSVLDHLVFLPLAVAGFHRFL